MIGENRNVRAKILELEGYDYKSKCWQMFVFSHDISVLQLLFNHLVVDFVRSIRAPCIMHLLTYVYKQQMFKLLKKESMNDQETHGSVRHNNSLLSLRKGLALIRRSFGSGIIWHEKDSLKKQSLQQPGPVL